MNEQQIESVSKLFAKFQEHIDHDLELREVSKFCTFLILWNQHKTVVRLVNMF